MVRIVLTSALGLIIAAAVGCEGSGKLNSPYTGSEVEQRAQLAAFAAATDYPSDDPSNDLNIGVLIDRRKDTITLMNFTDDHIRDATVWINGAYVRKVTSIPPNGKVTLPRNSFYDRAGGVFDSSATNATRVQLHTREGFYNLHGPVFE
jgi:hypothetical protein